MSSQTSALTTLATMMLQRLFKMPLTVIYSDFCVGGCSPSFTAFSSSSSTCAGRDTNAYGTTGQPAIVYLPSGTYQMAKSIQLRLGTVLMGDPTSPPTLKAVSNFPNDHIIFAKDPVQPGTNNFFIAIKHLVIDSTNVDTATAIGHIDWTVSQATQLTNIVFNMPDSSTGHAGVTVAFNYPPSPDPSGFNSAVILNDLTFNGGATGMILNGQQWLIKGMSFRGCNTGIRANGFNVVVHNSSFTGCTTGINAYGVSGSLTVLDTVSSNVGTLVSSADTGTAQNSIILENVINDGKTVVLDNSPNPPLTGNVPNTWVHGNMVTLIQRHSPTLLTIHSML
jgi:glucan 1,3-beta-glucosidase